MKTHAFRLQRGQDLRKEIDAFVSKHHIKAAVILTCVGNLQKAILRMAGGKKVKSYNGSFEIVSLVGTAEDGNSHLHISLSDDDGAMIGGHLKEGSIVGVTAEIVVGELESTSFTRKFDKDTGYEELVVE